MEWSGEWICLIDEWVFSKKKRVMGKDGMGWDGMG